MTGFIIACLLVGLGVAVILVGLVKSASWEQKKPTKPDGLEDITNPSHSWHPLNMWNDDN